MQATAATDDAVDKAARPGSYTILPGQLPSGQPILSCLLKRSYVIVPSAVAARAEEDRPLNAGDVPWIEPVTSSVRYESDFVPYKLATDVVINGQAHAPGEQACQQLFVEFHIGKIGRSLLVVGDRIANFTGSQPTFTDPKPFAVMDLKYERAYGGVDVFSMPDCPYPYPRNPLGRGFVIANSRKAVQGRTLPNVEDPHHRLTPDNLCVGDFVRNWAEQPWPACFGWCPKTWQPRASLAGIMPGDRPTEQELRKAYAPLVPKEQRAAYEQTKLPDMDFKYFSGASAELSLPYLSGSQPVVTRNLSPEGEFRFHTPEDRPSIAIDIGEGSQEPEVVLHTLMIDMEARQLDMVWRAAIEYPGLDWLPQLTKLEVQIA
ncbi:MAG: DUF2169 domain-containing protein [Pirellulaceae bacterium]|nr:DUF2169 domain-containing protein [Pirellulaceae bacterium]